MLNFLKFSELYDVTFVHNVVNETINVYEVMNAM